MQEEGEDDPKEKALWGYLQLGLKGPVQLRGWSASPGAEEQCLERHPQEAES